MTDQAFEPARLRLARELNEWSQADLARRLGISGAAVGQYESAVTRPSAAMLRRMADLLDVPKEFFALALVDTHDGFFRALRRTSVGHRRRARAIAQVAHDVAMLADDLPDVAVPQLPIDLDADRVDIEDTADHVRRKWGMRRGPIANVVAELEKHGVLVIRLPLDTADVDAFSLPFGDRPVIVLGSDKDDRARSRFDAAHELGHLVLHGDQVWGVKQVEDQAHAFAAAFLMPRDEIYDQLPTRADWPALFALKRQWQVSLAALLMRARTLDRISESNYLTAVKAASARGWRRLEPIPLGHPEQPTQLLRLLDHPDAPSATKGLPGKIIASLRQATAA